MNEGIYYLRLNGKVEGPFSIGQIYDLWAARKINSQTLFARFEEMEKWQPLSELTLKISAPKSSQLKTAAPETPTAPAARPRTPAGPKPEEYVPASFYQPEPKSAPTEEKRKPFSGIPTRFYSDFSLAIGFCLVAGTGVAIYSLFFYARGGEPSAAILATRQNGVIAGVGLILMGGLLILARQIAQILNVLKGDGPKRDHSARDSLRTRSQNLPRAE